MNHIEDKYKNAIDHLNKNDRVSFIIWARKTAETLAETIYKKNFPNSDTKHLKFAEIISKLKRKELIPTAIIPQFWGAQKFGNEGVHEGDLKNEDLTDNIIDPVYKNLKNVMNWYREELRPEWEKQSIDSSAINPHYYKDLDKLKNNNFDPSTKLHDNTVLIIVGSTISAELFDRPLAGMLRDEIERKYPLKPFILSDLYYLSEESLQKHYTISIGIPANNNLSAELTKVNKEELQPHCSDHKEHGVIKTVIWGRDADETRSIIYSFIADENGLKKFAWSMTEE